MLGDERGEGVDIAGVAHRRDKGSSVGVVEGGRQRVEIGRDGGRARAAEGAHDVDALSRTGEEDGGHDGRG